MSQSQGAALDVFTMTDQPPECPMCMKRVAPPEEGNIWSCRCGFTYVLEEDEDDIDKGDYDPKGDYSRFIDEEMWCILFDHDPETVKRDSDTNKPVLYPSKAMADKGCAITAKDLFDSWACGDLRPDEPCVPYVPVVVRGILRADGSLHLTDGPGIIPSVLDY